MVYGGSIPHFLLSSKKMVGPVSVSCKLSQQGVLRFPYLRLLESESKKHTELTCRAFRNQGSASVCWHCNHASS